MRCVLAFAIPFACAGALFAQTQAPQGFSTDWDAAVVIREIGAHAERLLPALESIDVKTWTAKGASETYAAQLRSSKEQARAVADGAKALAERPEQLSASLELYFRIESIRNMLGSIEEGLRKYPGAGSVDDLVRLDAEIQPNRDRFRSYLVDLAAAREHDLQVMDQEAQRCRGIVATPPPQSSGRKK